MDFSDYSQEIAEINNNIRINNMKIEDDRQVNLRNKRATARMERHMWTEVLDVLSYIEDGKYIIKLHKGMGDFETYEICITDADIEILPEDYIYYIKHNEKPYVNIVLIYNNMDEVIKQIGKQVEI